ncbi:MAG: hypothetical protein RBR30_04240 [Tenuifilaceae bacterium]|jgi:Ser-tRNA(Ala) deacylase AlaX|nr:hypothetical protein [Tenuifilaceae bacterium]
MSEKNYDPQMHTAEHILNQTMVRMFGCSRSVNSHIERKKSKCDYHIPYEPTNEQIQEIEKSVNDVIALNLPVTDEEILKDEASQFLDLSKLPDNAPERLRVVRVDQFDACACIGPHVENTSQIGQFFITSHSYSDGTLRLRFKLNRPSKP